MFEATFLSFSRSYIYGSRVRFLVGCCRCVLRRRVYIITKKILLKPPETHTSVRSHTVEHSYKAATLAHVEKSICLVPRSTGGFVAPSHRHTRPHISQRQANVRYISHDTYIHYHQRENFLVRWSERRHYYLLYMTHIHNVAR